MKRSNTETLTSLVHQTLRLNNLDRPLNEFRLIQSWATVTGNTVARLTGELSIRNQTLYVQLKSPALRANLLLRRRELTEKLNKHVGAPVITDIVFH